MNPTHLGGADNRRRRAGGFMSKYAKTPSARQCQHQPRRSGGLVKQTGTPATAW
ncbi:hypothetical protein [endosymbiont of Lamellibrachia barhami]|uniref:hypothetical protein n=1 Tax=endosymbiont of Lamellibrachia barhami TaxID=205975 RepID=UPI0015AF25EF|nr:hypothetical protein [endosymbiont of Lamellibrachia barhami]